MADYRKLEVWQLSHQLTLGIYEATMEFPKQEIYGLSSQMRRASYSIPSNIAEGFPRHGTTERAQFINIAAGSAGELEYFLLLACDLKYLSQVQYQSLSTKAASVGRMLSALYRKIKSDAESK